MKQRDYGREEDSLKRFEAESMARGVTRALALLQVEFDDLNQHRYHLEREWEEEHARVQKLERKIKKLRK